MEDQQQGTSSRLDQAAAKAVELIQGYSDVNDPHSENEDNPWRNPEAMYEKLDEARKELNEAWAAHQEFVLSKSKASKEESSDAKKDPEEFRALYMDMITDAFADVIQNMREQGQDIDVDILVDCLQSGMDLLSQEERIGFFEALDEEELDEDNEDQTPYHEIVRKKLGLDVSVASF